LPALVRLEIYNAEKPGQFQVVKGLTPYAVLGAVGHANKIDALNHEEFRNKGRRLVVCLSGWLGLALLSRSVACHMRCSFAKKLDRSRFDCQLPFGEWPIRIWAYRANE
jgi:hypothetical protein